VKPYTALLERPPPGGLSVSRAAGSSRGACAYLLKVDTNPRQLVECLLGLVEVEA
jgi:hypothetical protein